MADSSDRNGLPRWGWAARSLSHGPLSGRRGGQLSGSAQSFHFVGGFPSETFARSAEMAKRGGLPVNGAAQVQLLDHTGGSKRERFADDLAQTLVLHLPGAE